MRLSETLSCMPIFCRQRSNGEVTSVPDTQSSSPHSGWPFLHRCQVGSVIASDTNLRSRQQWLSRCISDRPAWEILAERPEQLLTHPFNCPDHVATWQWQSLYFQHSEYHYSRDSAIMNIQSVCGKSSGKNGIAAVMMDRKRSLRQFHTHSYLRGMSLPSA